ncbi:MAG: acyl carrier protein [Egibacteraceae bacterium]
MATNSIDDRVEAIIVAIVVDELGVDEDEVTPQARFIDDLGADSLDCVELVISFEEEFNIEIPDEDAEKLTSVRNVVDYLKRHMPPD